MTLCKLDAIEEDPTGHCLVCQKMQLIIADEMSNFPTLGRQNLANAQAIGMVQMHCVFVIQFEYL